MQIVDCEFSTALGILAKKRYIERMWEKLFRTKNMFLVLFVMCSLTGFCQSKILDADLIIENADREKFNLDKTENGYVYQEPVHEEFYITTLNEDEYKLTIFNSYGEKMMYLDRQVEKIIPLDVSTLSKGTYYIVLRGQNYKKSFKFYKV